LSYRGAEAGEHQHLMPLRGVLQRLEQAHEPIVVGVDDGIVDDQRCRRARVGEKPGEGTSLRSPSATVVPRRLNHQERFGRPLT
jgi:hypothetical protein